MYTHGIFARDVELCKEKITNQISPPNLCDFILQNKVNAEIIELNVPMKTCEQSAEALQTDINNIFKSILLNCKKTKMPEYVLVILPGDTSVDYEKVANIFGWPLNKISLARENAVLEITGFKPGCVSPIGLKQAIPVLMDEKLFQSEFGYAGSGKLNALLKISPQEIQKEIQKYNPNVQVVDVVKPSSSPRYIKLIK